jgi:hypothetical protein
MVPAREPFARWIGRRIMARTPNVKIIEWGTPPEPEPTGWDAVAAELQRKPEKWANVGEMSPATARKIAAERLTPDAGYEVRAVATKDDRKVAVWIRYAAPSGDVETRADIPQTDAPTAAATVVDLDAKPAPRATVKRGGVV